MSTREKEQKHPFPNHNSRYLQKLLACGICTAENTWHESRPLRLLAGEAERGTLSRAGGLGG